MGEQGVRTRSTLEICLPLALFAVACLLSLPTLLIAFAWMTVGVMSLGHRSLESFPTDGIRPEWLTGYRGACLWFYHIAWWPWYMRSSLRDIGDRIGRRLFTTEKLPHDKSEHTPDKPSDGEREEGNAGDAHRGKRD